jgi:hypothetical protein
VERIALSKTQEIVICSGTSHKITHSPGRWDAAKQETDLEIIQKAAPFAA